MSGWIRVAIVIAVLGASAWCGSHFQYKVDEVRRIEDVAKARVEETAKCNAAARVTEEASNALQKRYRDLSLRHTALLNGVQLTKCVPLASEARGHNADAIGNGFHGQGGITWESLLGMAATCDRQTAQLIACQQFINDTWKLNGQ